MSLIKFFLIDILCVELFTLNCFGVDISSKDKHLYFGEFIIFLKKNNIWFFSCKYFLKNICLILLHFILFCDKVENYQDLFL